MELKAYIFKIIQRGTSTHHIIVSANSEHDAFNYLHSNESWKDDADFSLIEDIKREFEVSSCSELKDEKQFIKAFGYNDHDYLVYGDLEQSVGLFYEDE